MSYRIPPDEPSAEMDGRTGAVIGAAIEVHRTLGPGFLESVYEEAMGVELELRGVSARRQVTIPITYKGHSIGNSRVDMLVDEILVVELKAAESIQPVHIAQLRQGIRRVVWNR